ncbi:MAG: NifU family protein [Actinomycetota bacterium]|nr:NifU family protein [Actinomycetota bacterium]
MSDPDEAPVLQLTDAARARVIELRAGEPDAASLGLWVEISGTSGDAFTYDMYFQAAADAEPADSVTTHGGLSIVIPADSMDNMRGALLDLSREVGQRGMVIQNPLVIQNPNQPPSRSSPAMGRPLADLSGDVAQRVVQVLDGQINPAIAAHGGHAELVAVEDDTAYLRLSGGCAGCGMAAVTLSQGIEVAIFESAPEVKRVIDVTDHAAGTNPYYEAAKK